jgi:hypothetical protein
MRSLTASEIDLVVGGYNGETTGTRIKGGSYFGIGGTGNPGQIAGVLGNGLPPQPTMPEAPPDPDGPPLEPDPDEDMSLFG